MSEAIRLKHYSLRTEETYLDWVRRYILFHNKRHPKDMGTEEIQNFLTHLATEKKVAASTQNQALSAILFLYRHVLHIEIDFPTDIVRAQKPKTLPTVLTHHEALSIINKMDGTPQLMTKILYGSGLRLPSLLRHPPPPKRLRYKNRPGAPRPQRRKDHHDLHPRTEPRRFCRPLAAGLVA